MKLKSLKLFQTFCAFCLLSGYAALSFAEAPLYIFGVIPQFRTAQLQKEWLPILERVSKETGVKLKLYIPESIAKFDNDLNKGMPDFAFMNPYEAVLAKRSSGYIPLLHDKKPLNGILVVRKDSPYKKVSDLDGLTIGFPAPNAFGASLYLRATLSEQNPIKFTPKYLQNHNIVFRHVLMSNVAAGGTVNAAFNDEAQDVQDQITILFKTPDVAAHPISAHPRVPEQVRKNVVAALVKMQQDAEGLAMLKEIRMPNLVEANYQRDYQPLEKLNIEKYIVPETK